MGIFIYITLFNPLTLNFQSFTQWKLTQSCRNLGWNLISAMVDFNCPDLSGISNIHTMHSWVITISYSNSFVPQIDVWDAICWNFPSVPTILQSTLLSQQNFHISPFIYSFYPVLVLATFFPPSLQESQVVCEVINSKTPLGVSVVFHHSSLI